MVSILSACITLAVSVGVQSRPSAAPQTGPWSKDLVMFGSPSFADASSSLGTVVCKLLRLEIFMLDEG